MNARRQVVELPWRAGAEPMRLTRVGEMFFSSSIVGADPESGRLSDGPEEQFELAFRNLRQLLEMAGVRTDEVGLLNVCISDQSHRPFINRPWLATFPDERNRPARKTTQYPLPSQQHVQLQTIGVVGGKRQPLELPGLSHKDPLPAGARVGDLVFSSVIGGQDPSTGRQVEGTQAQVEQAFRNMQALVEQAGGTWDDIALVWVFLRDRADQPAMIEAWLRMFPAEGNRPARKTIFYDELKGRATLIQLQMVAVLGQGRRANYEVPGVGHHDPIPMGTRVGRLLFSSGVGGRSPADNAIGDSLERQLDLAFGNLRTLLRQAGGSADSLGQVTVLLRSYAHEPLLLERWRAEFPNPADQPARHVMTLGLSGSNMVQLHAVAVI